MPVSETPLLGRAEAIAVYVLAQIVFACFAFASPLFATFAEWRYRRAGDRRYLRLARDLARVNVVVFGVAAVFTLTAILVFAAFWPAGGPRLLSLYFWPASLAGLLYLAEGMLLAYYLHAWSHVTRVSHLAAGLLAAAVGLGLLLDVNSAVAAVFGALPFALGEADSAELVADRFVFVPLAIPGWSALAFYRALGALSLAGLVLATFAALGHLWGRGAASRAYLRWVVERGLRFGAVPLLALPLVGALYLAQAPVSAPLGLLEVAVGSLGWAFNAQVAIGAVLLLLGDWYLVRALKGTRGDGAEVARDWTFAAGMLAVALGAGAAWWGAGRGGETAWEPWAIAGLPVGVYAAGLLILERNLAADGDWSRPAGALLPLAALCAVFALLPVPMLWNAAADADRYRPWQLAAVINLATLLVPSITLYLRARSLGRLPARQNQPVLLPALTGLSALGLLFLLGYVRDVALGAYVLSQQVALADPTLFDGLAGALPLAPPVALWLLFFGALLLSVIAWGVAPALGRVEAEAEGEEAGQALPPAA